MADIPAQTTPKKPEQAKSTATKDIELVFSGRRYRLSSERPQAIKKIPEPDRSTLLMLLKQLQPEAPVANPTQAAAIDLDLLEAPRPQPNPEFSKTEFSNTGSSNADAITPINAAHHNASQSNTLPTNNASNGLATDTNPTPKSPGDIAALMASLAEQERAEMNKRMNTKAVWKWFGIIVLGAIGLIVIL